MAVATEVAGRAVARAVAAKAVEMAARRVVEAMAAGARGVVRAAMVTLAARAVANEQTPCSRAWQ